MQPVLLYLQYLGFAFLVMFFTQMLFGTQSFTQLGLQEMYIGLLFGILYALYHWYTHKED